MQRAVRSTILAPEPLSSRPTAVPVCVLVFILLSGSALKVLAAAQYSGARSSAFAHAERLREALEGRPEQQRTRLQYDRVIAAYRAIYHGDPASPKADASIAAVADLLAEEGRVFQDEKALHDAIGQYEFLRHQYPGSRYRFSALLTEAEIYQRDLADPQQAKATYQNFLHLYPQNALGVEARVELKNIHRDELAAARAQPPPRSSRSTARRASSPLPASQPPTRAAAPAPTRTNSTIDESNIPPATDSSAPATEPSAGNEDLTTMDAPPPPRRGRLPLITGIRHWSTPDYTRVAIDLQQEVRYQAARVSNPDRIFFDLSGTRLSPELSGRAVEVTDDGFLTRIRAAQTSVNTTRIVLDVSSLSDYSAFFLQNPSRLVIDVHGNRRPIPPPQQIATAAPLSSLAPHPFTAQPPSTRTPASRPIAPATSPSIPPQDSDNGAALTDVPKLSSQPSQVRATRHPTTAPVVASVPGFTPSSQPTQPPRSTRNPRPATRSNDDVPPAEAGAPGISAPEPAPAAQHTPNSMVRALGLKINRIVIDAGHGGHDSGTLGPGGLQEKDIVLDVALRLGRLLKQRLGADVIYTRSDDTFIPLETRTAIANQAQADLFISVHANSSPDASARGVEVYYLNFTSSADALEVAARENASSDESIHQLSDLVKKIALQDKINESRAFADDVDSSLYAGLDQGNPGLKDRGVKKAPFVVLIGANMPSILAEISFLTNPDDADELHQPQYRQRIAESLYRGVSRYVSSLNGIRVAQTTSRPSSSE
ncbi:MAG TPA: N-acetylmuramoyl-L-alanine amidase [Acidobacteriaceae bacterium]|jgi:N-acetylmuramoyl-L-alanine amidase|nr:N-acetylmuramoyl-L-alanine amidase [Acidobacteriaceae bacterium]